MEVNVVGPSLVIQHFMPFLERSTRPVVLNLTSGMGSIGLKCHGGITSYSISKTALNMLVSNGSLWKEKTDQTCLPVWLDQTYKLTKAKPHVIAMVMDPGWVKTGERSLWAIHSSYTNQHRYGGSKCKNRCWLCRRRDTENCQTRNYSGLRYFQAIWWSNFALVIV